MRVGHGVITASRPVSGMMAKIRLLSGNGLSPKVKTRKMEAAVLRKTTPLIHLHFYHNDRLILIRRYLFMISL
jgi:hypothetical protein